MHSVSSCSDVIGVKLPLLIPLLPSLLWFIVSLYIPDWTSVYTLHRVFLVHSGKRHIFKCLVAQGIDELVLAYMFFVLNIQ